MQSTIIGLNKANKALKAQSSLNTPLTEEEENHKEKETGNDAFFFPTHLLFSHTRPATNLIWPVTTLNYDFHSSEILIPPPKI